MQSHKNERKPGQFRNANYFSNQEKEEGEMQMERKTRVKLQGFFRLCKESGYCSKMPEQEISEKAFVIALKRNDEGPNKGSSCENRGKGVLRHLLKIKTTGLDEALKIGREKDKGKK